PSVTSPAMAMAYATMAKGMSSTPMSVTASAMQSTTRPGRMRSWPASPTQKARANLSSTVCTTSARLGPAKSSTPMATMSSTAKLPATTFTAATVRSPAERVSAAANAGATGDGSELIARISPSTIPLSASTRPPTERAWPVTCPPRRTVTSPPRLTTEPSTVPATSTAPRATIVPFTVEPAGTVRGPGETLSAGGRPLICSPLASCWRAWPMSAGPPACAVRAEGSSAANKTMAARRGERILGSPRRSRRQPPKSQNGADRRPEEQEDEQGDAERPRRLDGCHRRFPEEGERQVARRAHDQGLDAVGDQAGGEDGCVATAGQPDHGEGEQTGDGGADHRGGGAGRPGLREPARDR